MALSDRARLAIDGALVLAWAGLVWVLGGDDFSFTETSRILAPLLEWLLPGWPLDERAALAALIRKLAHPVEYGVFAVLVLRYVDARQRLRFGRAPVVLSCVTALAFAALLAILDESRQSTIESRTGSPLDVGLDVTGAALALTLAVSAATLAGRRLLGVPGWAEPAPSTAAPPSEPPPA